MKTTSNGFASIKAIATGNGNGLDNFKYCLCNAIDNGIKLNKEQLIELADECKYKISFDEMKEIYSACKLDFKQKRAAEKLEAFKIENCCFDYKGTMISFKPCYCTINDRKVIVWKTNLDKNAIYYIYENEGAIAIKAIACVSDKNKSFEYRSDLVKGNKKKISAMLTETLAGCNFDQFFDRASKFKGFREVEIKGALKAIKL